MNRLVSVIGKAPSELPWEELLSRLRKERERVAKAIEVFRASWSKPARARATKATTKQTLSNAAKASGMSIEELMRMIEEDK